MVDSNGANRVADNNGANRVVDSNGANSTVDSNGAARRMRKHMRKMVMVTGKQLGSGVWMSTIFPIYTPMHLRSLKCI